MRFILLVLGVLLFFTPTLQAQSTQPHGVYVVSPGGNLRLPKQANIEGQAIFVLWSRVDNGQMVDWGSVESQIAIWNNVGKPTALVVWLSSIGPFSAIPDYVLNGLPPTVSCTVNGTTIGPIPDFLSPSWQIPAESFISKLLLRYGNDPRISYIRIGPLVGGETYPACLSEMVSSYGMNETDLERYADSVLSVESRHMGSVPLMVALNCYGACQDYDYPNHIASTAASYGIGVGQEAMQASDITNYNEGNPTTANWADIFALYPDVFHELQFNPAYYGDTNILLPFAGRRGARVVEMESSAVANQAYQQAMTNFDNKSE